MGSLWKVVLHSFSSCFAVTAFKLTVGVSLKIYKLTLKKFSYVDKEWTFYFLNLLLHSVTDLEIL